MLLSKFYHSVTLDDGYSAVFNALLMDIVFLESDEIQLLNSGRLDKIEDDLQEELVRIGVLVEEGQDDQALACARETYLSTAGHPVMAYFLLTNGCNLACEYCFVGCDEVGADSKTMPVEIARLAIEKFCIYLQSIEAKSGTVIFYGGEPLLNWDVLVEVVRIGRKLFPKLEYTVVTNATLLDDNKKRFIAESGISVGISIDGPKEVNDRFRRFKKGNASVFDAISGHLDFAKSQPGVGLSITLPPENLSEFDSIVEWLCDSGIGSISYNMMTHTNPDERWRKYSEDAAEFLVRSHERVSPLGVQEDRINRKLDALVKHIFKFADCAAIGGNQIAIKPDGAIAICHAYENSSKYDLGNIVNLEIASLLEAPEATEWIRYAPIMREECLSCEAIYCCGGGCPAQAEALFGNRSSIDTPFCIHTKKLLKWYLSKTLRAQLERGEAQC